MSGIQLALTIVALLLIEVVTVAVFVSAYGVAICSMIVFIAVVGVSLASQESWS